MDKYRFTDFKIPDVDKNISNLNTLFGLYRRVYNSGIEILNEYNINPESPNELEWLLSSKINALRKNYEIPKCISDASFERLKDDVRKITDMEFLRKRSRNMEVDISTMNPALVGYELVISENNYTMNVLFSESDIEDIFLMWHTAVSRSIVLKNGKYFFRLRHL